MSVIFICTVDFLPVFLVQIYEKEKYCIVELLLSSEIGI